MVKHEAIVAAPTANKAARNAEMLAPSETEVEQPILPGIEEPEPTKTPKRRRRLPIILLVIAAIIGIGAWRFLWPHGAPEKRAPQDVQSVGAAKVTAGTRRSSASERSPLSPPLRSRRRSMAN